MEKPKLRHPRYIEPIRSSSDRNLLIDEYLPRLIAKAKEQGWNIESDTLLNKQRIEVNTHNQRIIRQRNKERAENLKVMRNAVLQRIMANKRIVYSIPDENRMTIEHSINDVARYVELNIFKEVKYELKPKVSDLVRIIVGNGAFDNLPDPRINARDFERALFDQYNGRTLFVIYPNDRVEKAHSFEVKFVWTG